MSHLLDLWLYVCYGVVDISRDFLQIVKTVIQLSSYTNIPNSNYTLLDALRSNFLSSESSSCENSEQNYRFHLEFQLYYNEKTLSIIGILVVILHFKCAEITFPPFIENTCLFQASLTV